MATKKTTKKAAKKTTKKAAKKTTKKAAKKTTEKTSKPQPKAEPKKEPTKKQDPEPTPVVGVVELIGLEEMADQLKLPAMRVRQMLRTGKIRGVKVDGEWRFNPKLVYQMLGRRSLGR